MRLSVESLSLRRPLLALPLLFILAFGNATAGEEMTVDGVLHIRNAAEPRDGLEKLRLEERWRVGGDDEELIFGRVIRATTDDEGNVYLLDAQLCQVEVLSPEGEHQRTLSREGEGPGEIRAPADMIFLPDDTFGIVTRFPGRMTKLDLDGNPAGVVTVGSRSPTEGGFSQTHFGAFAGGNLYFAGNESSQDEINLIRTWFVGHYDADGQELARLYELETVLDFRRPKMIERELVPSYIFACAAGPDGRFYTATERERYEITVYHPDGGIDRVIEKPHKNRPRTSRELKRWRGAFESWSRGAQGEVEFDIEKNAPAVASLQLAADGQLWVESSRGGLDRPEDIFVTYDVFDPQGHFAKQVAVECEGDPALDGLFFLNATTAVLIKGYHQAFFAIMGRIAVEEGEEAANMEIVCYRIPS